MLRSDFFEPPIAQNAAAVAAAAAKAAAALAEERAAVGGDEAVAGGQPAAAAAAAGDGDAAAGAAAAAAAAAAMDVDAQEQSAPAVAADDDAKLITLQLHTFHLYRCQPSDAGSIPAPSAPPPARTARTAAAPPRLSAKAVVWSDSCLDAIPEMLQPSSRFVTAMQFGVLMTGVVPAGLPMFPVWLEGVGYGEGKGGGGEPLMVSVRAAG